MEELKKLIDEHGLKVSVTGLGNTNKKLDKVIEKLDRIAKLLYFIEQRDQKKSEEKEK